MKKEELKEIEINRKKSAPSCWVMLVHQNGITLISLIITIILLLILAGVVITFALGENGIFMLAQDATEKYKNVAEKEETELAKVNEYITNGRETVTISKEEYDNLLSRLDKLENKSLNSTPVITVSKSSTTTGNKTIVFTDGGSYMSRKNNEDYSEYDASQGFIIKKSGMYLIIISRTCFSCRFRKCIYKNK